MVRGKSLWGSLLFVLGLVCLYVGERLISTGSLRWPVSGAGLVLVATALLWRGLRWAKASPDRKPAESTLGLLALLGAAGAGIGLWLSTAAASSPSPAMGALSALWPALVAAALFPLGLVELAYGSMARSPRIEGARIHDALLSGLGMAGALTFAFSAYYVASELDAKWDLSYFRTARPGDATRKLVESLDEPVRISLFFPPANEVEQQVVEYLTDLTRESANLAVDRYDFAIDPVKARELGVSGNGAVVLTRGTRREQFVVGQELERARSQLANFDQELQKRLLMLARSKRTVYLTVGHGERGEERSGPNDQRATARTFKELLQSQNYEIRSLGPAEGLASDVPRDAAAVLVLSPSQAFMPEEAAALARYFDRGGRVLLALDPDPKLGFSELLAPLGLAFTPIPVVNDEAYLKRTRQVSDRGFIGTASFTSHPSVTTLGQLGTRAPLILGLAGSLERTVERPAEVSVDFTVHAHPATWSDLDGDFEFDAATESRKASELAAAVVRKAIEGKPETEGRVVVLADSDALVEPLLVNLGNTYFALDGIKWLLGEEALSGTVSSEVDVPIEHTRKQDVLWFYSTLFVAPVLVLAIGVWVTRRRGLTRRRVSQEAS